MPAKNTSIDFNNLINLYLSGESLENLAHRFRTSVTRIKHEFSLKDVALRTAHERRALIAQKAKTRHIINDPFPSDEIIQRYLDGESENSLAEAYKTSRTTIRRRLTRSGIPIRSYSEANLLKASQMTPEERLANAKAAHDAVRGYKHTLQQLEKRAFSRQKNRSNQSAAEKLLEKWLLNRGIPVIVQQAVSKYNVDLGAFPIAVEVFGGGWHFYKNHIERFNYLFNRGWSIVIVYVNGKLSPLTEGAADYIASFFQETTSNPSTGCQYRVIWGEGKLYAAGGANGNELASIVPLRSRDWHRPTD